MDGASLCFRGVCGGPGRPGVDCDERRGRRLGDDDRVSLYSALMVAASIEAVRHASARRIDEHRAWGDQAVRAGDRVLALSHVMRLLDAVHRQYRPHRRFQRVARLHHGSRLLYSAVDRRGDVHPRPTGEGDRRRPDRRDRRPGGFRRFRALATFFFTTYGCGPAIATRFGS